MPNYIKSIRKHIGHDLFICPAARIIIENDAGEYLFIRRTDNGRLGLPAGAIEFNETIEQCICREVIEETGLVLNAVKVIGISSNPTVELATYPNGDATQYLCIEFYATEFTGEPKADGVESSTVFFGSGEQIELLPANERSTFDSLRHYKQHNQVFLK